MVWPPIGPNPIKTSGVAGSSHLDAHTKIAAALSETVSEVDSRVGQPEALNSAQGGEGGTVLDSSVAGATLWDIVKGMESSLNSILGGLVGRLDALENKVNGTPQGSPPPATPPPDVATTVVSTPVVENSLAQDGYSSAAVFSMAGVASSDVLVLIYGDSDGGSGNPLSIPSGWTQIGSTYTVGNIDVVACAIWGGSFGGSVTIGRGVDRWHGCLFRISGCNLADVTALTPVSGSGNSGSQFASISIPSGSVLLAAELFDGTIATDGGFVSQNQLIEVPSTPNAKRGSSGYRYNDTDTDTPTIGIAADYVLDPSKTWVKAYGMALAVPEGTPTGYPQPTGIVDPVVQSPSAVGGKWLAVHAGNAKNYYGMGPDSTFSDLTSFKSSILPQMNGYFTFTHPGSYLNHWKTDSPYGPKNAWNLFGTKQYAPLDMWDLSIEKLGATSVEVHLGGQSWTITELASGSALPSAALDWFTKFGQQVDRWMTDNPTVRVLIRMWGEHNGTWAANVGSPNGSGSYFTGNNGELNSTFKAAWARVHSAVMSVMSGSNAPLWIWAPMGWYPGQSTSGSIKDPTGAYPGDAYVDVLGPDWYTAPGSRYAEPLSSRGGVEAHLDKTIDHMRSISATKPVGIGECGVGIPVAGRSVYPSGVTPARLWSDFLDVCIDKQVSFFNLFYHKNYLGGEGIDWTLLNADADTLSVFRSKSVAWLNG